MAKTLTPIKPLRIISSNGSPAGLGTGFPLKSDITEGVRIGYRYQVLPAHSFWLNPHGYRRALSGYCVGLPDPGARRKRHRRRRGRWNNLERCAASVDQLRRRGPNHNPRRAEERDCGDQRPGPLAQSRQYRRLSSQVRRRSARRHPPHGNPGWRRRLDDRPETLRDNDL